MIEKKHNVVIFEDNITHFDVISEIVRVAGCLPFPNNDANFHDFKKQYWRYAHCIQHNKVHIEKNEEVNLYSMIPLNVDLFIVDPNLKNNMGSTPVKDRDSWGGLIANKFIKKKYPLVPILYMSTLDVQYIQQDGHYHEGFDYYVDKGELANCGRNSSYTTHRLYDFLIEHFKQE